MTVCPVVVDWGPIRSMLSMGGSERTGSADIILAGSEKVAFQGSTTTQRLVDALRESKVIDADLTVYSWNEADTTQFELWRASVENISEGLLDPAGTELT